VAGLARLRVALGFVMGALVLVLARPSQATVAVGMTLAACGEAIRFWAAGHLQKSREVTVSGPYRWTAHPLYLGSTIMGIGLAISRNIVDAHGGAIVASAAPDGGTAVRFSLPALVASVSRPVPARGQ